MTFKEKQKAKANQLAEKVSALLEDHDASTVLDALLEQTTRTDHKNLVDSMVAEVGYRTDYKLLKLNSLNEQLAYEDFLERLYPMFSDRQLATL